jgi:hypothetical protein
VICNVQQCSVVQWAAVVLVDNGVGKCVVYNDVGKCNNVGTCVVYNGDNHSNNNGNYSKTDETRRTYNSNGINNGICM